MTLFTYIWQVVTALLCITCLVFAFASRADNYGGWFVFVIDAFTFAILFATAYFMRADS